MSPTFLRIVTLLVVVCSFGLPINFFAQSELEDEDKQVLNHIYNFQFRSADTIVGQRLNGRFNQPYWYLISSYVAWSQILAGNLENESWNNRFTKDISIAKSHYKESDLNQNENLYLYIIVHAFKTRHELLHGNYLSAANDLNTCIDQISESFGREEEYPEFYLTSGLYYYFMDKAREEYFWLRPYLALYPEGDRTKGLTYLRHHIKSDDVFLRNESNYFLMRIFYDLEEDFDLAALHANSLVNDNPNNLIYGLYQFKITKEIDVDKAEQLKKSLAQKIGSSNQLSKSQQEFFISELDQ